MKFRATILFALFLASLASAEEGYFRSPALHGDLVVFTAEGDLWSYRLGDESAQRLTTHPSLETDAAISPDGQQVAFTADYEGASETYVMPITGGVPQRVTFENSWTVPQGWTPNGKVLYSTISRPGPPGSATLRIVDPADLSVESIPLADAFSGSIASDALTVYFIQFGLSWDNVNIYRGGLSGKLWRFAPGPGAEATRLIANHEGDIRRPMASTEAVYFISDASGRDNLWAVNLDGSNPRQVTRHEDLSMRGASVDGDRAVYQLGADLYLLDLASGDSSRLDIHLQSDHPSLRESWETEPMKHLHSARLSGDAEKVAITARGAAALAGTGSTRLVSIGAPGDARIRQAARSHDGNWVYAISDASGEPSIWRYSATGGSEAEQMTNVASTLGSFLESPDGRFIAYGDGNDGLWLLNTENRDSTQIINDSSAGFEFTDMEWSANSQLLAVTHVEKGSNRSRVLLRDVDAGRQMYLTSDKYESYRPAFSQDGQWLYYLSNRNFDASGNGVWQDRDFGPSFDNRAGVFARPLTEDATFPFAAPNELTAKQDNDDEEEDEEQQDSDVDVDWDGLSGDVWQAPLEFGDYDDLAVNEGFLYVLIGDREGGEIKSIKLEPEAQAETFAEGVAGMELSSDGSKMLVAMKGDETVALFVVAAEAAFPEDPAKGAIQTAGWQIRIDPRTEWIQMFDDAWLMHRDQFFDTNMRGVDWDAMREKYRPLAMRVTDRHELNDVLGQMMAELNALHSAVRGGDVPADADAPAPSVLGAALEQTDDGVVISRIYRHDEEVPSQAPPLAQPGVDAQNGDMIREVNGIVVSTLPELHRALTNQAGKQVLLKLRRGREDVNAVVVPADAGEDNTYQYQDWVNHNRSRVETANAELGYLHIRAMGSSDAGQFARDFYASNNKKGFIIDVRRNNGGNIDSWIIERLLRRAWMFWSYKGDPPSVNMQNAFRGHLVVLADERTYSDGETFTAAIKALGIAPVIGQRTSGAGVWLSGRNRLSDGGIARVAESPVYSMDGRWVVEGRGVSPTIEVRNMPHATYMGSDTQLESAIEYLQNKLQEEPIPELIPGPFPENGVPAEDVNLLVEP